MSTFTFVAVATNQATSASTLAVNKPTGTVDNDIMFALVQNLSNAYPNSSPAGWTKIAENTSSGGFSRFQVWYKLASSEGASYTWGWAAATQLKATIVTYRGGFNVSSPIDSSSNTQYITNDTVLRAASFTVASANSPLIFLGGVEATATRTFTKPTVPNSSWTEDYDGGDTGSDCWQTICSMTWTSSGATGNIDATISNTMTNKHAFAVSLKPEPVSVTPMAHMMQITGGII